MKIHKIQILKQKEMNQSNKIECGSINSENQHKLQMEKGTTQRKNVSQLFDNCILRLKIERFMQSQPREAVKDPASNAFR